MIKVIAKMNIKPDKIEKCIEVCRELAEETRKEPGCLIYELYQDIDNPQNLTFDENWVSQEALAAHMQAPHFLKTGPLMADLAADGPVEITRYQKLV